MILSAVLITQRDDGKSFSIKILTEANLSNALINSIHLCMYNINLAEISELIAKRNKKCTCLIMKYAELVN